MNGIRVVRLKTFIAPNHGKMLRMLDFLSFMITGFCGALVQKRPDVIVATSPQFLTAVAGWLASAVKRAPFVFELGDIWPASIVAVGAMDQGFLLRSMERFELFLYRRSEAVVALTPAFKRNLMGRGIAGDKIAVVMNGVDLTRYGPRDPDTDLAREWNVEGKFLVGYIGTHGMAHGLMNVLDAAEVLRDEPRICFLLVGDGAERKNLVQAARERDLRNVVLIPTQPKQDMPRIWSICNVALVHLRDSPVFSEVIPSKTFEAMAMGIPVLLATPSGEASRILAEDEAGLHVEPEDPQALADAVTDMMGNETLLQKLSNSGMAASLRHTRLRQAQEMLQTLEIVAGKLS